MAMICNKHTYRHSEHTSVIWIFFYLIYVSPYHLKQELNVNFF